MSRMEKVNQQIKREIGTIIQQEMGDPRLEFVSITKVDASRDLRNARVYFTVLGDAKKIEQAQQALISGSGFLRRLIGQKIKMCNTPELSFFYDNSLDMSNKIEEALKEIKGENTDDQ